MTDRTVAALHTLLSAFLFIVSVTLVKFLGGAYSAALQTFYRQLAGLILLAPLLARNRSALFRVHGWPVMLLRSAALTLTLVLSFYSFQLLPLAEANALSFTRVLWIMLLAAIVLKRPIGLVQAGLAAAGFVGVLIILRPGALSGFGAGQLAALGGALSIAVATVSVKSLSADNSIAVLVVWSTLLGLAFSAPLAALDWRWPDGRDLALLAAMGIIGLLGQLAALRGLALGDPAVLAPIEYSRIVFATGFGFVLFDEVPDGATVAGAAIIIASTLAIQWRGRATVDQPAREQTP